MQTVIDMSRGTLLILAALSSVPLSTRPRERQRFESAILHSGTLAFRAHATVGDFTGSTSAMAGAVDGSLASARGWVEARVATLATQNGRRDRDMRVSLEADRYPTMRFDLAGATVVSSLSVREDSVSVLLHGQLAIHGVTRRVDLPATVSQAADTIRVIAVFPVDMADYHIGGLTKMLGLLRVQRRIEVRADLRFVRSEDTSR